MTIIKFQSAVVCQISSQLDDFSLKYGDLTILNMAAVRHLNFRNFEFVSHDLYSSCHSSVSLYAILLKFGDQLLSFGRSVYAF